MSVDSFSWQEEAESEYTPEVRVGWVDLTHGFRAKCIEFSTHEALHGAKVYQLIVVDSEGRVLSTALTFAMDEVMRQVQFALEHEIPMELEERGCDED